MTRAHGTLARYKRGPGEHGQPGEGCRCAACRQANAAYKNRRTRLIAYGRWDGLIDATGTHRRLQALVRNGWSLGKLSARLGTVRRAFAILRQPWVTAATAARVRVLYDELWDQPPPLGTWRERQAASQARNRAAEQGWPPPLGWCDDEIDDPDAKPAEDWERSDGKRRWGVLAEDTAFLLETGVEPEQVAERLGVSRSTLGTTLARVRKQQEAA